MSGGLHDDHPPPRTVGPAVAGRWYAGDPGELAREVDGLIQRAATSGAAPTGRGRLAALIAPHAGFTYSGTVAAGGFRLLLDGAGVRRVVLLGPSHSSAYAGAALPRADAYRTPLGDVPLDAPAVERLVRRSAAVRDDLPFVREHSLEAELPFLQRVLAPGWRLVPLLLGGGSEPDALRPVASGISELLDDATLLVASSDFTHYGARFGFVPFVDEVPDGIRRLDHGAIDAIRAGDATGFNDYVERTGATICGRAAISTLLDVAPDGWSASLCAYDTSGRMTGDWSHTVSYASIAFHEPAGAGARS